MNRWRGGLRWLMIALAFVATAINYMDRQTLSATAPVARFQMSDEAYGRVIFAFGLGDRPLFVCAGVSRIRSDAAGVRCDPVDSAGPLGPAAIEDAGISELELRG